MLQETRCFDAVVELYSGLAEDDILAGDQSVTPDSCAVTL